MRVFFLLFIVIGVLNLMGGLRKIHREIYTYVHEEVETCVN